MDHASPSKLGTASGTDWETTPVRGHVLLSVLELLLADLLYTWLCHPVESSRSTSPNPGQNEQHLTKQPQPSQHERKQQTPRSLYSSSCITLPYYWTKPSWRTPRESWWWLVYTLSAPLLFGSRASDAFAVDLARTLSLHVTAVCETIQFSSICHMFSQSLPWKVSSDGVRHAMQIVAYMMVVLCRLFSLGITRYVVDSLLAVRGHWVLAVSAPSITSTHDIIAAVHDHGNVPRRNDLNDLCNENRLCSQNSHDHVQCGSPNDTRCGDVYGESYDENGRRESTGKGRRTLTNPRRRRKQSYVPTTTATSTHRNSDIEAATWASKQNHVPLERSAECSEVRPHQSVSRPGSQADEHFNRCVNHDDSENIMYSGLPADIRIHEPIQLTMHTGVVCTAMPLLHGYDPPATAASISIASAAAQQRSNAHPARYEPDHAAGPPGGLTWQRCRTWLPHRVLWQPQPGTAV